MLPDNLEYCYYIIINLKHNGMPNLKKNAASVWSHLRRINRILLYSVLPLTFMLHVIQSYSLILTSWINLCRHTKCRIQLIGFCRIFITQNLKYVCNTLTKWTEECNTLLM